jgi:hypothetical protein
MATNPLLILDANNAPRVSPSVSSRWTFDQTTQSRFVSQHDVILLSYMEGGQPNTLVPFLDDQALRETYDPENLHILGADLASYLKAPSFDLNVRGAYRIYVLRLGHPTRASLTLLNGAAQPVLLLTSVDYGIYVNKLSAEVASGTVVGKRVTIRFRQETTILDNLQNAFQLAYTGNASAATITITRTGDAATRLQTTLTGATDGSISLDLDLTQETFATIQQLATYINGQNGYDATLARYAQSLLPSLELDAVAGATIRTPPALIIRYIGAGTAATMTTTATALTTTVTGGPGGQNLSIDLTVAGTNTLAGVVASLASHPGVYTCTLGPNAQPEALAANLFALVVGQDIRTANYSLAAAPGAMDYVATAALGSIVYAVNSLVPRVSAARVTNATTVPANIAQTFFSGGTNPVPTTNDWLAALDLIEQEDLIGALLFPVSTNPVIQDAVNAWVSGQHSTHGKSFRSFFASPDNTDASQAQSLALGFNSTFAALITQPLVGADGVSELAPIYAAACYCGAAAGALPVQPVTRVVVRGRALPTRAKYAKVTREIMLSNGVAVLEDTKGVGVRIALAVTTSLSQDRIDRILSESMARDVIEQRVKIYCEPLIPHWAMLDFLPTVKGAVFNALTSLEADGIITKGRDAQGRILPAWQPVQVSIQGGILKITLHVLIGGELSHILIFGSIGYQLFEIELTAGV